MQSLNIEKPALTLAEVAVLMGLSVSTVTRLFKAERGVLVLGRPASLHKRAYKSVRIPRYVYERVVGKLAVK